jgi:hypothetical protein
MKFNWKSVFITLGVGLFLAGCADNGPSTVPHVFRGIEVPQDVLDEPRIVQTPPAKDISQQHYPRLGDVPSKPNNFTPRPVLNQAVDELEFDRAQAQKAEHDYENPPVTPVQPY